MANEAPGSPKAGNEGSAPGPDFIRAIVAEDVAAQKNGGRVATRFPPEPNGYLHIGHAKSICLNFGVAREFGGTCNLRFDDTNPTKESTEYVDSIKQDVRWLGHTWNGEARYASDYFEQLAAYAVELIEKGLAYVDSLPKEQIREYRGTLTEPGRESPYRNRSAGENLDLFARMRAGEFADGAHVLRAKIDMAHPNILMRDPTLYRIRKVHHHRTGDAWCVYPMYDFTHCLSDAIEGITHSLCTLEFENNRALYDWVLDNVSAPCHPRQYEFARLNLTYTVLSKRRLIQLVEEGAVRGWDDPRMPTIQGLRRRGYTPASIRAFCDRIGVARRDSMVDMALLEYCVREDLNAVAPRVFGVLNPVRVRIVNWPGGETEEITAPLHPENPGAGTRTVPFTGELWIERDDFMEDPPKKFFRLAPGREVRLRYAYFIKCEDVVRDPATGEISEILCTYDPATKGGDAPDGRKVKATLHWLSAAHALPAEVRLYESLFNVEDPAGAQDWRACLNPDSLKVLGNCYVEPYLAGAGVESRWQFERLGYFCVDPDSAPSRPVFNRTVSLRDAWAKIKKAQQAKGK